MDLVKQWNSTKIILATYTVVVQSSDSYGSLVTNGYVRLIISAFVKNVVFEQNKCCWLNGKEVSLEKKLPRPYYVLRHDKRTFK